MHVEKFIRKINKRKFLQFFLLNFSLICLFQFLFLKLNLKKESDLFFIPLFLFTTLTIITLQYPILKISKNWIYKVTVYWLSMNLFFFLVGFLIEISLKSFENGFKMIIYGNLMLLPYLGLVLIISMNYFFRKQIF